MRKKKAVRQINYSTVLCGLLGIAFLLVIYLVQAAGKLIKVQAANAEAAKQVYLPQVVPTGGSCGT